ncbi:hypothetical protein LUZ63_009381 [Rhynchospora breviuscula]|uniref:KIB1-4 beta-propeller domain-containing protein n=1 Tax=Rhynchospora breviuscula TaxID=2022672 RepID=A0A9Q0HNZ0_9POAL|nr:hypothetical protein LUZ63_009381 [Rhynchospora breviuscula]
MCEKRERDQKRERERDWSALPHELIHLISKRISGLCGFVRFRAVCKRWHASVPLSDAPLQLPWLLEGNGEDEGNGDYVALITDLFEKHRFYSLFTGETGTICGKPTCQEKYFSGPSLGHLLTRDIRLGYTEEQKSCHLFNPLTDEEISLAPRLMPLSSQFVDSVIEWQSQACIEIKRSDLYSYCHYRGLIYSTRGGDSTQIVDNSTGKYYMIRPLQDEIQVHHNRLFGCYLVESAGVVLRVSFYLETSLYYTKFRIYKLMFDGKNYFWFEISSIGDQVLFLDVIEGFSINATSFPRGLIRGNSIYFLCPKNCQPCRYDIEHGVVERLQGPFQNCTWFVPTLRTIAT